MHRRCGRNFESVISEYVLRIKFMNTSFKIAFRWWPRNTFCKKSTTVVDKSTLVQVMDWCRQTTSHYLCECDPMSMSPYAVTRPQWVTKGQPNCVVLYICFLHCCLGVQHGTRRRTTMKSHSNFPSAMAYTCNVSLIQVIAVTTLNVWIFQL